MSKYNGTIGEIKKGLYRLMKTDTLVLIRGVEDGHYDVSSFPTPGLRINKNLIQRLVPLSEAEKKRVLADSEIPIWLANQTRGSHDLGVAVGESLGYRRNPILEETVRETTNSPSLPKWTTTQNNSVRTCGDCNWFDTYQEDPCRTGRCLLFDSVDSEKRDHFVGGVEEEYSCKYGILTNQRIPLTNTGIARIVNKNPGDFFGKTITAKDINLNVVMRVYDPWTNLN